MKRRLTSKLIKEVLPAADYDKLTKTQRFDMEIILVEHLLSVTSYIEYSKAMRKFCKVCYAKAMRNLMLERFEIVIGLKYALMMIMRHKIGDEDFRYVAFKRYMIEDHSKLLIGMQRKGTLVKARKIAKSIVMPLETPQKVIHRCSRLIEELHEKVSKRVWWQCRFLIKHYNVPAKDIISDMQTKGVRAFYEFMPFLPEKHLSNSVKNAMDRKCVNIIKEHTAAKRNRLTNDGDGNFSKTTVNIDYDGGPEGDGGTGQHHAIFKSVHDPRFGNLEMKLSMESIVARHGVQPRKKKVLDLIQLKQDPEFVATMHSQFPQTRRAKTTEEIFDALDDTDTFLSAIRLHTRVCEQDFAAFLGHIKDSVHAP